jgi:hypothetical protein
MRWQMREAIWSTGREDRPPAPHTAADDLEALQGLWDVRFFTYPHGRRWIAMQVRRQLHAALFPLLERISEFNAAVASRIATLSAFEESVDRRLSAIEHRLEARKGSDPAAPSGPRLGRIRESLIRGLPGDAVIAVDPHEVTRVRTIRAAGGRETAPVEAGLDDLALFGDTTVDAIVLSRELEHATEQRIRAAFMTARHKLKAGGVLTIWGSERHARAGDGGLEPDVIRRLLVETGFTTVVRVDDTPVNGAAEFEISASNGS